MNKQYIFYVLFFAFFLLSFTLHSHIVSASCVQGIDGICDYNCIDVDFDCLENPHQEGIINEEQLSLQENTTSFSYSDNAYLNNSNKSTTSDNLENSNNLNDLNDSNFSSEDVLGKDSEHKIIIPKGSNGNEYYEIIKETDSNKLPLGWIIGGGISILILLGIIVLIYVRFKYSKRVFLAQKNQLIDYILKLQGKNYSNAQIKKLFLDRGYTESFINSLFKDLKF